MHKLINQYLYATGKKTVYICISDHIQNKNRKLDFCYSRLRCKQSSYSFCSVIRRRRWTKENVNAIRKSVLVFRVTQIVWDAASCRKILKLWFSSWVFSHSRLHRISVYVQTTHSPYLFEVSGLSPSTFVLGAKPHAAEIDLSATLTRKTLEITGTCDETTGQRWLGAKSHAGVARSQTGCAGSEIHGTWLSLIPDHTSPTSLPVPIVRSTIHMRDIRPGFEITSIHRTGIISPDLSPYPKWYMQPDTVVPKEVSK